MPVRVTVDLFIYIFILVIRRPRNFPLHRVATHRSWPQASCAPLGSLVLDRSSSFPRKRLVNGGTNKRDILTCHSLILGPPVSRGVESFVVFTRSRDVVLRLRSGLFLSNVTLREGEGKSENKTLEARYASVDQAPDSAQGCEASRDSGYRCLGLIAKPSLGEEAQSTIPSDFV